MISSLHSVFNSSSQFEGQKERNCPLFIWQNQARGKTLGGICSSHWQRTMQYLFNIKTFSHSFVFGRLAAVVSAIKKNYRKKHHYRVKSEGNAFFSLSLVGTTWVKKKTRRKTVYTMWKKWLLLLLVFSAHAARPYAFAVRWTQYRTKTNLFIERITWSNNIKTKKNWVECRCKYEKSTRNNWASRIHLSFVSRRIRGIETSALPYRSELCVSQCICFQETDEKAF